MTVLIRGLQPQAPDKRSRMSRHGSGADIGRKEPLVNFVELKQTACSSGRNLGRGAGFASPAVLDKPRFRRGFRKHLEDVSSRVAPPRLDRIESLEHLGSAHAQSVSNDSPRQDLHYGSLISVETDEPGTLANPRTISIRSNPRRPSRPDLPRWPGSPVFPPQAFGQTGRDQHHQSDTGERWDPLNPDQCLRADEPDTNAVNQTVATQNQA